MCNCFRSVSDVPIKVHEFAIVISNSKSTKTKTKAHQWAEINDGEIGEFNLNESDFMIQPNTLYKISFMCEPCRFSENSVLNVNNFPFKTNGSFLNSDANEFFSICLLCRSNA